VGYLAVKGELYRRNIHKRRTKSIGAFPDGNSALMLVCARLRHVAGSDWETKRYMNMDHLLELDVDHDDEQTG